MIDIVDITTEIYQSAHRLQNAGDSLFLLAKTMAETERVYRRALGIEIVTLKTDKMQATLIPDIARGLTADLLFERNLAEARWTSAKESLRAIQSQMSALQSILKYQQEI